MTVDDFIKKIQDEEARVRLIIETDSDDDLEISFWASDYRACSLDCCEYGSYQIKSFSFVQKENGEDIALFVSRNGKTEFK